MRNLSRRGWDALLVVLACAVGTAIITSALSVGDSLDASIRASVPETLGPVDVALSSYSPTTAEVAEAVLRDRPPGASDGLLGAVTTDAALATPEEGAGDQRALPSASLVEVDFDRAVDLGGPGVTGLFGSTPEPGEVALGRDAALELGVRPGDSVEAYAYGGSRGLRVDRVLPRLGVAGYGYGFDGGSANAFVAPGTISDLSFPGVFEVGGSPPRNLLLVSAAGGVYPGEGRTDTLLDGMREGLRGQIDSDYELEGVKADLLRDAEEQGEEFGGLFLSLGAFAVAAGAALLVNALVMLAEERRHEMGVLRSVGMKRADLAGAFAIEGGAYAAVAAAAGGGAGVGISALAVYLAGDVFSSATRGSVETMRFDFQFSTLLVGFLAGLLVALAVVAGASVWISRMTVIETLRGPSAGREPRVPEPRTVVVALLGLVATLAASVFSVVAGNDLGSLVFPCAALGCVAAYLEVSARREPGERVPAWISADGVTVAAMVWVVLAFRLLDLDGDDTVLFVAQGLVLALGAVVLAVRHGARLGPLLRGVGGGPGLALRLALTYPFERRFRTGVTLLAYALIVFTLVFSSVLSDVFSGEVGKLADDEGGGYDLLVTTGSAGPVDAGRLEAAGGVGEAATLDWTVAGFRVGGSGAFEDWAISGFDGDFLSGGPPPLNAFDREEYPNEAAVWEAVRADPGLVVADVAFLESGGGPPEDNVAVGDDVQVRAPGTDTTVTRRVVGISAAGAAFSGVMVSKESLAGFVENPVGNRHYVRTAAGSDPGVVAERLQLDFLRSGLEARTFEGVVREALRGQEAFFDLIEGYLTLGLLVGIAGLGVSMIRAVRERRRGIGVLRALGVSAPVARLALLAESGFVALGGVLIGASLALVTSYGLVAGSSAFGDAAFAVPWARLALLVLGVLLSSLIVTLPAIVRVARTPPATVLRAPEEGAA